MMGEIWVYGDLRSQRRWTDSLRVLTKALKLSREAGAGAAMVLMGAGAGTAEEEADHPDSTACVDLLTAAGQAAGLGVETVYCLEHPHLDVPRTDLYADVLSRFVQERRPWLVLLPLNDFGREIAAICAQRCRAGMIAHCTELTFQPEGFVGRCPAWGGQIMAHITLAEGWSTALVTVQPHGADIPDSQTEKGRIETIRCDQVHPPRGVHLVRRAVEPSETRRLDDAPTVVVGGAGMGDMNGFGMVRELAAALGGEVGATRPPVLYHWVGRRSVDRTDGEDRAAQAADLRGCLRSHSVHGRHHGCGNHCCH